MKKVNHNIKASLLTTFVGVLTFIAIAVGGSIDYNQEIESNQFTASIMENESVFSADKYPHNDNDSCIGYATYLNGENPFDKEFYTYSDSMANLYVSEQGCTITFIDFDYVWLTYPNKVPTICNQDTHGAHVDSCTCFVVDYD